MTAASTTHTPPAPARSAEPKRMNAFERYLTVWVALCMLAGVGLGRLAPDRNPCVLSRVRPSV